MTRPLVIEGANLILRAPEDMDNCIDIYVRRELYDGVPYSYMEVELTLAEREAILNGGTLMIGQVGDGWVPINCSVLTVAKEVVHGD